MRILTEREELRYVDKEVRRLPETVLRTLAVDGGLGKGNLLRRVRRSLPDAVELEQVEGWVDAVISYLVTRGDLERVTGSRYVVPPPYAVETISDGRCGTHRIRLHGDIRGDGRVLSAAKRRDPRARISHLKRDALATVEADGETERSPESSLEEPGPDLALVDRTLCLDAAFAGERCEELVDLFREGGCTLFSLKELAESLPSVQGLACPSERYLKDAGMIGGTWEVYVPTEESSWVLVDVWPGQSRSLVRRLVADGSDDGSDDGFRLYYHGGGGRVVQIGREEAALWEHYLNWVWGCQDFTVYGKGVLHVPASLTPSARRWLEAVVGRRIRLARGYEKLPLPAPVALYVQDVFEKKFGIKARSSFPKKQNTRRGR